MRIKSNARAVMTTEFKYMFRPRIGILWLLAVSCVGISVTISASPLKLSPISGNGAWPGVKAGAANAIMLQEPYAYVMMGYNGFAVFDISTPTNPAPVGRYYPSVNASWLDPVDSVGYLADGTGGLKTLDISNPGAILTLSTNGSTKSANQVRVVGSLAYVIGSSLDVYDISNPSNIVRLGGYQATNAAWSASWLEVEWPYAYLATSQHNPPLDALDILDVSNPTDIFVIGNYATNFAGPLTLSGSHLVSAFSQGGGIQVLDVSDPANIRLAGSFSGPGVPKEIIVKGSTVFTAEGSTGVSIYDISNLTNIVRLSHVTTSYSAEGIKVDGNFAYVADSYAGLRILDVGNPADVRVAAEFDTFANFDGLDGTGQRLFAADDLGGLQVFDVSEPGNPIRQAALDARSYSVGVTVVADKAYVVGNNLRIYDISESTNVVKLGEFAGGGGSKIVVDLPYAYVAAGFGGLGIFDVSEPTNIVKIGSASTPAYAASVAKEGHYACVATSTAGLSVYDVATPSAPALLGRYTGFNYLSDVKMKGNLAYAAGSDGLLILDISNPEQPTLLGRTTVPQNANALRLLGNLAFVADSTLGVAVFDISNPTNIVLIGTHPTTGSPQSIYIGTAGIYTGNLYQGLDAITTMQNVSFCLRAEVQPGIPFTLEKKSSLAATSVWTTVLVTNPPSNRIDVTDWNARAPQSFYRAHQP